MTLVMTIYVCCYYDGDSVKGGGSDGNDIGDDSMWLVKMSVVIMMVMLLVVVHGSGGILGFHMM